mmetsp:Transcript_32991/g.55202  ORF Transcript_32991/g.55202 Transcript_32991/m.55202 type:complete len:219 (-) Transcript_32991:270-926(-)
MDSVWRSGGAYCGVHCGVLWGAVCDTVCLSVCCLCCCADALFSISISNVDAPFQKTACSLRHIPPANLISLALPMSPGSFISRIFSVLPSSLFFQRRPRPVGLVQKEPHPPSHTVLSLSADSPWVAPSSLLHSTSPTLSSPLTINVSSCPYPHVDGFVVVFGLAQPRTLNAIPRGPGCCLKCEGAASVQRLVLKASRPSGPQRGRLLISANGYHVFRS